MDEAKVFSSPHDGKAVNYVDRLKITHTGVVVGQSADGDWLYVRSDRPNMTRADWHFKIAARLIDAVSA
jgi:hypothetical protein